MNGTDGAQAFTDESGKIWTGAGNAQIDSAQSVFGGTSALFDGSGDYLSTPNHADFDFGSGSFTVDFWVKFNSLAGTQQLISKRTNPILYGPFSMAIDNAYVYFVSSSNGATWGEYIQWPYGTNIATGTWYHFAFVRNGSDWRFYLNGISRAFTTVSQTVMTNTADVTIGGLPDGSFSFNGWIDEMRVSKGVARWTANFTPPTSEYTFATPTPIATFTPTLTPTLAPTNTPTYTPTATFTNMPTNTPLPNYGGSGICWSSSNSWESYTAYYAIDRDTIPESKGWDSSLHGAAQMWNFAAQHFESIYSETSSNIISYGETNEPNALEETGPPSPLFVWTRLTERWTVLNSAFDWDTNNEPIPENPNSNGSTTTINVQNVMTHEFGHWLDLDDVYEIDCEHVTMWNSGDYGEISKITLSWSEFNAINWQYP